MRCKGIIGRCHLRCPRACHCDRLGCKRPPRDAQRSQALKLVRSDLGYDVKIPDRNRNTTSMSENVKQRNRMLTPAALGLRVPIYWAVPHYEGIDR